MSFYLRMGGAQASYEAGRQGRARPGRK